MRLRNYPLFETNDAEEANGRLSREFHSRTRIFSPRFSFAICSVGLSQLRVSYIVSRASRESWVEHSPSAPYQILARRRGIMSCSVRGAPAFDFGPGQIRLFAPGRELTFSMNGDQPLENIGISIPAEYLQRQAEAIAGRPLEHPFEPTGTFSSESAVGRRIEWMLNDLESQDSAFAHTTLNGLCSEGNLVAAIIEHTPNNYREWLDRPDRTFVSMWHVRRAEEWMMAHITTPFTIPDVARATGIGVRALEKAFARYRNCRPSDFRKFMQEKYAHWERASRR